MARHRILWVDDDWDNVQSNYSLIHSKNMLDEMLRNDLLDTQIKTEKDVPHAMAELSRIEYRLVIVDLLFNEHRFQVEPLLEVIQKHRLPFLIISNELDRLNRDNILTTLPIGTFSKSEDVTTMCRCVIDFLKAPPVRILHLSDLHINSQFENEIDKEEQRYLHRSFFNTVQSINKRASFDAVVICGDFSATNPDQDLDDASRFVTELNKNTINNYDRLAIVPGNHELHWDDFNSCKLSAKPYKPYLQFYHSVYSSRISIVAEMSCWDRKNYLFDPGSQSNGLCWYRAIPSSNLSFFGLATPSLDPACQGEGVFTPEQQDQISHLPELKKNEIRICLMHHNINSMLSLSKKTETCILRNAGSAMHCLLSSGFQLALSGHTHSFNFNRLINSRLTVNGFSRPKAIDLVSGGSFGGKSSSNDKPNSFNIIEFSHANAQSGLRTLSVSPVLYDSDERKWFERPPIDIKPFEI